MAELWPFGIRISPISHVISPYGISPPRASNAPPARCGGARTPRRSELHASNGSATGCATHLRPVTLLLFRRLPLLVMRLLLLLLVLFLRLRLFLLLLLLLLRLQLVFRNQILVIFSILKQAISLLLTLSTEIARVN